MPFSFRRRFQPRPALLAMGTAIALLAASGPAALAEDKTIATIDGVAITESDLALTAAELEQQLAKLPEDQKRAAAFAATRDIKLLAAAARKQGLADGAEFKQRMAFLEQRLLHNELLEKDVAAKITDADIRARYDKEIAATPPTNEVKASHILVKTKEEAEAIIKQLDAGGDFAAIAKEKSSDPGSGANGGDLGYFGAGQMVPEFEKAALALEVGSYTKEPVQTQFGFHIIKVEDKRAQQPPAFEQVKEQFRSLLFRENYFALLKSTRDAAKVEITDPALKTTVEAMDKAE